MVFSFLERQTNARNASGSNAGRQARLAAEARHERTLAAVACTPWFGADSVSKPR
jgi:hypothetical protein